MLAFAVLDAHLRKPRIGLQPGIERADLLGSACQKQVDALLGHQHRSFQRVLFGLREHAGGKCLRIPDGHELVGGGIGHHAAILEPRAAPSERRERAPNAVQQRACNRVLLRTQPRNSTNGSNTSEATISMPISVTITNTGRLRSNA